LPEALPLLAAGYRPPLRRGDLDAISAPAVVAVVDGILEPEARLPPEEAGRGAARGLRLFGAASVGALLAVDPSIAGAVAGVGRVVRLLRRGRARADDVAVLYAAHDLRPLTVPVVDVLCRLDDAVSAGCVVPGAAAAALAALRALPLEDRTPAAVAHLLRQHLGSSLPGAGDPSLPGVKAADARRLLRFLRTLPDTAGGSADLPGRSPSSAPAGRLPA
jgi:ribosomal protein S12 methylthiotransferase accessory factor